MLDRDTRAAILRLRAQGHSIDKITHDLGVGRTTVRRVIHSGQSDVPAFTRARALDTALDHVRALYAECRGNILRVQEELKKRHNVTAAYSSLTRFCRQQNISHAQPLASARILTGPGDEMQHDTSLYTLSLGGQKVRRHCASLVLGYSRRLFIRFYPRFDRFACKLFLTDAFKFMGGASRTCVIDNSSVILACGAGSTAQVSADMEAFEKRFGFRFLAHELGHPDRKGKVERPFHYIEHNFLVGRSFKDDPDLNHQALQWINEKANIRRLRELGASPQELFAAEHPHLAALPLHIPDVYKIHQRDVDAYGYVHLDTRRYSTPPGWVNKSLSVRETEDTVILLDGSREFARHPKLTDPQGPFESTLPGHIRRAHRRDNALPSAEETALKALGPQPRSYLEGLKAARPGRTYRWSLKMLHRLLTHYPAQNLAAALAKALEHHLWDVRRIEGILLQHMAHDRFQLPLFSEDYEATPEFDKGAVTPPPDLAVFDDPPPAAPKDPPC